MVQHMAEASDATRIVDTLLRALESDPSPVVRDQAARALGSLVLDPGTRSPAIFAAIRAAGYDLECSSGRLVEDPRAMPELGGDELHGYEDADGVRHPLY